MGLIFGINSTKFMERCCYNQQMINREFGIYVHIPFCTQKCYYCDFISFANKQAMVKEYVDALKKEIKFLKTENSNITTIYIGGGTPSFIEAKYIADIIKSIKDNFVIEEVAEITIEVNPRTVTKEKLLKYKEIGINRLSIGLQSTNNRLLKDIGRIHTYEDFLDTYYSAREVGFKNINVDLMLALPNQTLEELDESIEKVVKLNPEHISVYSLILEENTKLFDLVTNRLLILPDDDVERNMYWRVKEKLEQTGYNHYEISNFARTGYESKHNLNCWNQEEYIGVGVAAHSYVKGIRYSNTENLEQYICSIRKDDTNFVKSIRTVHEIQTKDSKQKEYMMLGLRKIEGISISKFKNKFSVNPLYIYRKELNRLVNDGLIEVDMDNIRVTNKGLDFANITFEEFV